MLTSKDKKIIDILTKVAIEVIPVSKSKIASALVFGNNITSFGRNSYKSHPLQKKFGENEHQIYLHSEIDSIKNFLKNYSIEEIKKTTMYIVRVKRINSRNKLGWMHGLAKPCKGCQRAIIQFGIKKVVYTYNEEIK